jgi:hypothetical protein
MLEARFLQPDRQHHDARFGRVHLAGQQRQRRVDTHLDDLG